MADVAFVVNGGLALIVSAVSTVGAYEPKYIEWGIGTTTATAVDTVIEVTAIETVATGASSITTTTVTNDTYTVTATVTCISAAKTITEVALKAGGSAGATMFMHGTFTGIAVSVGDSIGFTINNKFSNV